MNDPTPPPGLSPSQTLRWITAHRQLSSADTIDVNMLTPAERLRHFDRLRSTGWELLRLSRELAGSVSNDGDSVF